MLKEAGAESVLAPKVDNLLAGLLVRDFRLPQTVLTNHNPPYYLEIFQKCGYEVKSRILTFRFTRESVRQLDVRLPGLSTREFDRNNLTREVALFHHLQNSIFAGRNDYVPRTLEEDRDMVQSLMPLVDDELIIIAEDIEGNGVGVLICLPDVYQSFKGQQIDRARIVSIGVVPGWERKGGGALMACHLMRNLLRKGYRTAEASWILESNVPPQNLASRFNAEPGREFVLLSKRL
jgi:hypothetical protein